MSNKKEINKQKLPKLKKIILWILGTILGLFLIFIIGFKIWVSTWQTYRNDEFGFLFKYPKNWYITIYSPITKEQVNKYSSVSFYVDPEKNLMNYPYEGPRMSMGGVKVHIENTSGTMKAHESSPNLKEIKYGKHIGYTNEDEGGLCGGPTRVFFVGRLIPSCNLQTIVLQKYFDLESKYYFYVNTLSYTDNLNIISQIKVHFYHKIGSQILDSFNFD